MQNGRDRVNGVKRAKKERVYKTGWGVKDGERKGKKVVSSLREDELQDGIGFGCV